MIDSWILLKKRRAKDYIRKRYYCDSCGDEVGRCRKYCDKCWEVKKTNIKTNAIRHQLTRDELKEHLRSLSFVKIGKIYGCSDNAIRKICKTYNLPYRNKDIRQIDDWDSI